MSTPLEQAPAALEQDIGLPRAQTLYLKREDEHELGAFKWRGALPTVKRYANEGAGGVVTASTGNHGAATAWACRELGLGCVVFGPEGCSESKLELIRAQGASVVLTGRDLDEAKDAARASAAELGHPFFEDGAEPTQYEGYAAIALETLDQLDTTPAALLVPVGNGALLIGVGRALQAHAPSTRIAAVVAKEAPVMARSIAAGHVVEVDRCATFADGLAVRVAIPEAVDAIAELSCDVIEVSERAIARALGAYDRIGLHVEGSAAAALAAAPELDPSIAGPVVLLVTGRNIDAALYERAAKHPETFPD